MNTFTDAEIAAAMRPEDGNDAFKTIARLQAASDRKAFASDIKSSRVQNDASRFAEAVPGAAEAIAEANAKVAEAQAEADLLVQKQRDIIEGLEQMILRLGMLRARAEIIRSTFGKRAELSDQADEIFESHIRAVESPSNENQSAYVVRLNALIRAAALERYVPEFVARIEDEAAKLAAEIKTKAETHNVNLPNLLEVMHKESSGRAGKDVLCRFPQFLKYSNVNAFADLI